MFGVMKRFTVCSHGPAAALRSTSREAVRNTVRLVLRRDFSLKDCGCWMRQIAVQKKMCLKLESPGRFNPDQTFSCVFPCRTIDVHPFGTDSIHSHPHGARLFPLLAWISSRRGHGNIAGSS